MIAVDPVADGTRPDFREDLELFTGDRPPSVFILDGVADQPVIGSVIYPWIHSYIFVKKTTTCCITSRLGKYDIWLEGVDPADS